MGWRNQNQMTESKVNKDPQLRDYTLILPEQADLLAKVYIIALTVWREARGQGHDTKVGVAWSIRNRVEKPSWWGKTYHEVVLKKWQYSSYNLKVVDPKMADDPNACKYPEPGDASWLDCVKAVYEVLVGNSPDPTGGSTHYFDKSLDGNPPAWAKTGVFKGSIGDVRFYVAK